MPAWMGKTTIADLAILTQNPTNKSRGIIGTYNRKFSYPLHRRQIYPMGSLHVLSWGSQLDHKCKNRESWVGFTIPGTWVPLALIKSASSAYLPCFSGSALLLAGSPSPIWLDFPFLLSASVGPSAARAGSQGSPKRVPLVRNSWARKPASS